MTLIAIEPRGDNLGAVTAETRREAEIAAIGGYITQVWTWRGGEGVVLREWPSLRGYERWSVIVRRGLRRGGRAARMPRPPLDARALGSGARSSRVDGDARVWLVRLPSMQT